LTGWGGPGEQQPHETLIPVEVIPQRLIFVVQQYAMRRCIRLGRGLWPSAAAHQQSANAERYNKGAPRLQGYDGSIHIMKRGAKDARSITTTMIAALHTIHLNRRC